MATKVHMEALSPTMDEGQLVQWLKSEGDEISNGDILAEIETDKATMELVARGDGILRKIFLSAGGTADVGAVIAVIADGDEDISEIEGVNGGAVSPTLPPDTQVQTLPLSPAEVAPTTVTLMAPDGEVSSMSERVKASPLARRLADEMGVNLASV